MDIKTIIRPAGVIVGIILAVGSRILDGIDAKQLGLPFGAWETVGLGIFFVSVVAILYNFSKHIRQKQSDSSVYEDKQPSGWLEKLASQDLDTLKDRIKVEVRQIEFTGINDIVPNLKLRIRLVNTSVFRVKLLRCDGYIQLNGVHGTAPQLFNFPKLEHGARQDIELTQTLDGQIPQMLKELAATKAPVNVVGAACYLVFQVISEGYNQQVEIPISNGGLPCVPEGVRVVYGGNIGRLNS